MINPEYFNLWSTSPVTMILSFSFLNAFPKPTALQPQVSPFIFWWSSLPPQQSFEALISQPSYHHIISIFEVFPPFALDSNPQSFGSFMRLWLSFRPNNHLPPQNMALALTFDRLVFVIPPKIALFFITPSLMPRLRSDIKLPLLKFFSPLI